jgi:peptidyl-prolyl cis-trans isomerase D
MFNFFRSQGKAAKYLLGFLLVLVALSMLVYLVPNYDNSSNSANPVLLEVGSRKVTASEATASFQQQTQGRIPAEMMRTFFPQFLNDLKMQYATLEAARKLGIVSTDEEVLESMIQAPAFAPYFENGKLVRRQEFEALLAQQGLTIDTVLDELRSQMTLVKLRDVVLENTIITPKEVEAEYKRKYERATVDYIALSEADMRTKINISDEEMRQSFEADKAGYNQPEKYSFRVVVLSQDKVAQTLQIPEQELRAAYASALDNFRTPETVRARHILVATDGKSDAEKKTLRTKADDLAKQAKGGADFAELARKNSDDSGNAPNGGDLGTFGRGQMVKEFEDTAFSLKPGEVSSVVTTQFGYHVIKLEEKNPSKVTPFEQVKGELEAELGKSSLVDAMQKTSAELRAEIAKNPAAASAVAQKFGAELVSVTEAVRGTAIPTLGVTPEIDSAIPALEPNGVTPAISLPGDRMAVAILDKKIAGRPSTFDEAKPQVREKLMTNAARKMLDELSKEVGDRVKKGEDLRAVAKSVGAKVETEEDFSVIDNLPAIGPASYFIQAFQKGAGTVIGPAMMQNRMVIAKVVSKKDAEMSSFEAERKDLLLGLKAARAQQTNTLWMDAIVQRMEEKGEIKVNQDEVQRVLSLYR